jgi:hypothetical protein
MTKGQVSPSSDHLCLPRVKIDNHSCALIHGHGQTVPSSQRLHIHGHLLNPHDLVCVLVCCRYLADVQRAARTLGLVPAESFCDDVESLGELLCIRRTTFIVGAVGSGKSARWRTLAHARNDVGRLRTVVRTVLPDELGPRLFGGHDETSAVVRGSNASTPSSSSLTSAAETARLLTVGGAADDQVEWTEGLFATLLKQAGVERSTSTLSTSSNEHNEANDDAWQGNRSSNGGGGGENGDTLNNAGGDVNTAESGGCCDEPPVVDCSWIVFDGNMSSDQAATFVALMEHGVDYQQANGEVIPISPDQSFICECVSLDWTTPGLLSKAGLMHVAPSEVAENAVRFLEMWSVRFNTTDTTNEDAETVLCDPAAEVSGNPYTALLGAISAGRAWRLGPCAAE